MYSRYDSDFDDMMGRAQPSAKNIPTLDGFFENNSYFEDQESAETKIGLTDQDVGAMEIAQRLATKAKGGMFNNPQTAINKAYGDMMNKVAKRIKDVAKRV